MLESLKNYIFGEWQLISQAPATIGIAVIAIGLGLWAIFSWAYGRIIGNQDSEIRLLERQVKDFERQVDALQKKPSTVVAGDLVDTAELTLQIYGDERAPMRLSYNNIWRWYYLRNIMVIIGKETGKEVKHVIGNLYLSFDHPVKVGTLEVSAHGFILPSYEVKEFTNRYAIIVFSDELPGGNLQVKVY
jgi:hypothetical protein